MPNTTQGIPERKVITATITASLAVQKDIAHGPCTLLSVHVDNNEVTTPADHYIHIYDDLNPSMGASGTSEDVKLLCRASDSDDGKSSFLINPNTGGLPIANGLSWGISQDTAGATVIAENSIVTMVVLVP